MSDEQTMPDDLVSVNTVGWDADAMQEHVFDCHQAIRTLTAKQDSYKVQREMADLRYTDAQATIATLTAELEKHRELVEALTSEPVVFNEYGGCALCESAAEHHNAGCPYLLAAKLKGQHND